MGLINQNRQELFPMIIAALYKNSKQHWNSAVHGLTFNVLKLLMEADPQLFDKSQPNIVLRRKKRNDRRQPGCRSGILCRICSMPTRASQSEETRNIKTRCLAPLLY